MGIHSAKSNKMLSNASPDSSIPFQFKLFSLLSQQNKGENVLISPLSIFVILSLTANGANGQTKDEFLKGLSYETIEEVNEINKKIQGSYSKFTAVEVANAVGLFNDDVSMSTPVEFTNTVTNVAGAFENATAFNSPVTFGENIICMDNNYIFT